MQQMKLHTTTTADINEHAVDTMTLTEYTSMIEKTLQIVQEKRGRIREEQKNGKQKLERKEEGDLRQIDIIKLS